MAIKKAAVIGAGVMGAGIAAHLANAGIEVEMLDIVPNGAADRDVIAKSAIEKMLKDKPAPLMLARNAKKIRPGNSADHLDRLKDCDIIFEVIKERLDWKTALFTKIDEHRKPGSIVASNTSTIPLHDLIAGQSEQFKKDFVITHFFNPPRYQRLLELVTSEHNDPAKVAEIQEFMDKRLGKGVVPCHDTPGFIGNRIGTFWIQAAINEAHNHKLTIEEADAIMGKPLGIPKTGVFGLVDLVGLDLMPEVSNSLLSRLPKDDGYVKISKNYPVIDKMVADGYRGRKVGSKGGFYRINEKKEKFSVDLETGAERPTIRVSSERSLGQKTLGLFRKKKPGVLEVPALNASKKGGLRALVEHDSAHGRFARSVLKQTLSYAAEHAHDIADNIVAVDEAMKLGYMWQKGPFELIDKLGVDYLIDLLKKDGDKVPPLLEKAAGKSFYHVEGGKLQFMNKDGAYEDVKRPEGVLLLSDVKLASKPLAKNKSASLWDIGDGVACLEFHTPGNAVDMDIMKMVNTACDTVENSGGKFKALVIHNEDDVFSAGANLKGVAPWLLLKQYWAVEKLLKTGQDTYKRLKYAPFPVVSAPTGVAVGGGCEILLHSPRVQAHAETYTGLVEAGMGLLPAWGGTTELLTRAAQNKRLPHGPIPSVAAVFETVSTAKVSTSAFEAKDLMFLRPADGITMNRARLLADAKAQALTMAKDYTPEKPADLTLPGSSGLTALRLAVDGMYLKGAATPYDVVVADRMGAVISGGEKGGKMSQDDVRALERVNFMKLVRDPRTLARISYFFQNKKPLREKPIPGKTPQALRAEADRPSGLMARIFSPAADFTKAVNGVNDNDPSGRKAKPQAGSPGIGRK